MYHGGLHCGSVSIDDKKITCTEKMSEESSSRDYLSNHERGSKTFISRKKYVQLSIPA